MTLATLLAADAATAALAASPSITPYIFAGVGGAVAVACALAVMTLSRRLALLNARAARAERQAAASDLSLERIFFVGPEGGLKPATAATEADARAVAAEAAAAERGPTRLVERMFGRETVRELAPLLESLAVDGRPFELRAEDASGAPTLYIGDVVGAQALLRVWPELEEEEEAPSAGADTAAESALARAPIGVLIFSPTARLAFVNDAARRLLRLRPERLENAPTLRAVIDDLREFGRVPERTDFTDWRAEVLADPPGALSKDGLWILGNGDALRVSAEPTDEGGFIVYVSDETSAVGLERRYRIALGARRATLAAIDEGIAVVGADGLMQLVNPAFARMWGAPSALTDERSAGEVAFTELMRGATQNAPRQSRELWRRVEAALAAPAPRRATAFEADKGDGTGLEISATPLPDGATLIVMRDVTAHHIGAAALKARAANLEEADGLKTEFLNNIAYQLRTPLNAALGFTDMLLRDMAGELTEKQREYVAYAHAGADELREIVADALDLGALTAGSAELAQEPLDLGAAALAVSGPLKARAERRGAAFRPSISGDPAPFVGDEPRLRHAFFSVASAILATAATADAFSLRYAIEPGRPGEDARAVVEIALARAHPESGGADPLAKEDSVSFRLARRIVEAHGGELTGFADADGASVRFEFPLAAAFARLDLGGDRPGGPARDDAA